VLQVVTELAEQAEAPVEQARHEAVAPL